MELSAIIENMLKEVKTEKGRRGGKGKRKVSPHVPKPIETRLVSTMPGWHNAALVLVCTTVTCRTCSREFTYPNSIPHIKRTRLRYGKLETHLKPLDQQALTEETNLPKKLEHISLSVSFCQHCFFDIPNADTVKGQFQPPLPFIRSLQEK